MGSEQCRLGHLCGFQRSFWKLWGGMWIRAGMGMHEGDSLVTQGSWKDSEPAPITRTRPSCGAMEGSQ